VPPSRSVDPAVTPRVSTPSLPLPGGRSPLRRASKVAKYVPRNSASRQAVSEMPQARPRRDPAPKEGGADPARPSGGHRFATPSDAASVVLRAACGVEENLDLRHASQLSKKACAGEAVLGKWFPLRCAAK